MGCCCQKTVETAPTTDSKPQADDYSEVQIAETPQSTEYVEPQPVHIPDESTMTKEPVHTVKGRTEVVETEEEHDEEIHLAKEKISAGSGTDSAESEVVREDEMTETTDLHHGQSGSDDGIQEDLTEFTEQNEHTEHIEYTEHTHTEHLQMSDESDREDIRKSTQSHWRQQTTEILMQIDANVLLGSHFEEVYNGEQFHCSYATPNPTSPLKQLVTRFSSKHSSKDLFNDAIEESEEIESPFVLSIGSTMSSILQPCLASNFKLRTTAYATNRKSKHQSSDTSLYNVIGADCFQIDANSVMKLDIRSMLKQYDLESQCDMEKSPDSDSVQYPKLIIVSMLIPLFTKKERNGIHLIVFCKPSQELNAVCFTSNCYVLCAVNVRCLSSTCNPKKY